MERRNYLLASIHPTSSSEDPTKKMVAVLFFSKMFSLSCFSWKCNCVDVRKPIVKFLFFLISPARVYPRCINSELSQKLKVFHGMVTQCNPVRLVILVLEAVQNSLFFTGLSKRSRLIKGAICILWGLTVIGRQVV